MGHISVQQLLELCGVEVSGRKNGEGVPKTLVLTPNNRLSRFVHRQYDLGQAASNKKGWVPLKCMSLQLWLQQQWRFLSLRYPEVGAKHPLSHSQALLLWQDVVTKSEVAEDLFNTSAAAETALRAWNTLSQWCFESPEASKESAEVWRKIEEESPAFVQWVEAFQKEHLKQGCIDENALMGILTTFVNNDLDGGDPDVSALNLPERIVLLSFDSVSPLFKKLIQGMQARGVIVEHCSLFVDHAETKVLGVVDSRHELKAAAAWAHQILLKDPSRKIGVVIPDLSQRRVEVESVFYNTFEPQYILPSSARHAPPFNISASIPLASTPPIAAAINALQLNRHKNPIEDVVAFLHSPFIGNLKDLGLRALLSESLEQDYLELSLNSLRARAGEFLKSNTEETPLIGFHNTLVKFSSSIRDLDKHQSPSVWSDIFTEQLNSLGWPGERSLDTLEYQQVEHWKRALQQFSQLDRLMPSISLQRALECLVRVIKDTAFQAKTDYSPIQILGLLEASGLVFDDVWIMGMDDENWPLKVQPNSLLPLALQRTYEMPRASVDRELDLAREMTTRFSKSAANVIFSHPEQAGEKHLSPSALLSSFPRVSIDEVIIQGDVSCAETMIGKDSLESFEDAKAGPLNNVDGIRGGTQILQDQAACPFKAFATHRLFTRTKERATPGYTPQDRGSLIHLSLELIWKSLESSEKLHALPEKDVQALVESSIDTCFRELFTRGESNANGKGVVLTSLERSRMVSLIMRWLSLEKEREPFAVVLNEGRQHIEVNGLPINVRYDRVDKLADGGHLILDYKTGLKSLSSWEGERPDDPQVPIYSVAFNRSENLNASNENALSAVAFAQINIEELAIKGVGESSDLIQGIKAPEDLKRSSLSPSWGGVLEDWKRTLEKLANEFLQGEAAVDPKRGSASCQYCHLQSLCRVNSSSSSSEATVGENDD